MHFPEGLENTPFKECKGQLISKSLFSVFKPTKKPTFFKASWPFSNYFCPDFYLCFSSKLFGLHCCPLSNCVLVYFVLMCPKWFCNNMSTDNLMPNLLERSYLIKSGYRYRFYLRNIYVLDLKRHQKDISRLTDL